MSRKKVLILAPVMASHEQGQELLAMLSFLAPNCQLTVLDPLVNLSELDNEPYYKDWQDRLSLLIEQYDAFIGFSFGAVILQQCFPLFETHGIVDKPIILISAPAFADQTLRERLGQVIAWAQAGQLDKAHNLLMTQVRHPFTADRVSLTCKDIDLACARLNEGLTRVLTTDSRAILSTTLVAHYCFIGEQSYLVNQNHIVFSNKGTLIVVPNAGMRVLQDNVVFCHQKIGEILS